MKYVIYTRQSKPKKVKIGDTWALEEDSLSHQMQLEEIKEFIGKSKYIHYAESNVPRDEELENRPILKEALDSLKKGDKFIVWKSDRLVADTIEMIKICYIVQKEKKCSMLSVTEPGFFDEGFEKRLYRLITIEMNLKEVEKIRERVCVALKTKKAKGERVGHIPYGYKLRDEKFLAPNEDELLNVNLMATLYYDRGLTIREIVDYLNNEDILNREGHHWSKSAVHRILKNRLVHSEVFPEAQEILQREIFQSVG